MEGVPSLLMCPCPDVPRYGPDGVEIPIVDGAKDLGVRAVEDRSRFLAGEPSHFLELFSVGYASSLGNETCFFFNFAHARFLDRLARLDESRHPRPPA